MTNAIEQSKREMYDHLESVKRLTTQFGGNAKIYMTRFEEFLETHFEVLRQDLSALHETARKRFEDIQSLEEANAELSSRLSLMTMQRDILRNRQQASDHAQGEAPEKGATMHQISAENVSCATLDGKTAAILGAAVDIRKISDAWAMTGRRAKKSMLKISGMLARPEVYSALEEIGKSDSYAAWFIRNTQCMHSFPSGEQCVFCGVGK